ncbi:Regulatory protein AfsR [Streptomyces hundungensis]|uniref:Regulatory protein AfsR n=1 Tax=Streptomyces hundungensis TaxID=1077946 RepID=A0A387H7I8_9ACTN|nr:BTAD domain-containing putative transcriptional regulator [Streptomyces hundungensis]AYG79796.1 Regulatory protein AfsR [Streptomyces hundungensis]
MIETIIEKTTPLSLTSHGVQVKLLGVPEILVDDQPVPLRGETARRVLCHLLLASPRAIPNQRLIESVWGGEEPDSAMEQIRKIVSKLRRDLPGGRDLITTELGGYRITLAPEQLDLTVWTNAIQDVHQLIEAGDHHAAFEKLSLALDLWRGPALDGLDGQPFANEAVALHEERLNALETWCRLAMNELPISTVIAKIRREISQHPLQERLWDTLMRLLADNGRPLEALNEYSNLRKVLAQSLGVSPSPRLQDTYRRLELMANGETARPNLRQTTERTAAPPHTPKIPVWIKELLRGQEPNPAYVSDKYWNIVHRNQAMARWFPWLQGPDANLMTWALTNPSARRVLGDWEDHAAVYLGMIDRALRQNPDDAALRSLSATLSEADSLPTTVRDQPVDVATREGHHYTLNLPHITPEPVNVVSHILTPHGHGELRVVLLTSPQEPAA